MSQPNRILPQSKETLLKSYTKRLKDDVKSILDNFTEIVKSSKVINLTEIWGLKPAWRLSLLHWALSSEQTIHLTSIFTQDYFEANGVNYFLLYCISFHRCVYFSLLCGSEMCFCSAFHHQNFACFTKGLIFLPYFDPTCFIQMFEDLFPSRHFWSHHKATSCLFFSFLICFACKLLGKFFWGLYLFKAGWLCKLWLKSHSDDNCLIDLFQLRLY